MADCKRCGKDIEDPKTTTCIKSSVDCKNDTCLPRVPFQADDTERCPVCNVILGGVHHEGCYMERCPCCGERIISCGCAKG